MMTSSGKTFSIRGEIKNKIIGNIKRILKNRNGKALIKLVWMINAGQLFGSGAVKGWLCKNGEKESKNRNKNPENIRKKRKMSL